MNELVVPLANAVIKFSIAPYEPSAAIAKAPSIYNTLKTFIYHLCAKKPRTHLLMSEPFLVNLPVARSKPSDLAALT
jgi:hypothetical protein